MVLSQALEPDSVAAIKSNLRKAIDAVKADKDESKKAKNEEIVKELAAGMTAFESIGKAADSTEMIKTCTEARTKILKLLDEATGEPFSTKIKSEIVYRDTALMAAEKSAAKPLVRKVDRQSMGLVDDLMMTETQYKALDHQREAYIEESEKVKEEVERRLKREAGEDVEEDEDDDDDDDMSVDGKSSKKSTPSKEEGDGEDKKKAAEGEEQTDLEGKIGKPSPYDFFSGDDPSFPDLIRRCLAVLRVLCASPAGETFVYPVDAQANPRYYEIILKPVSLHDIGKTLREAGKRLATNKATDDKDQEVKQGNPDIAAWSAGGDVEKEIESVVAEFGRSIRRISLNTACYSNVGASIISSADEMLRLFERLFFDWVLAPAELLPPLEHLDDEKCINPHDSDCTAVVLICDGCEGKFNMERIVPAMKEVPKGDWYCQRCVSGRCWGQLDPRIGRKIQRRLPASTTGSNGTSSADESPASSAKTFMGTISRCIFSRPDRSSKSSLAYVVSYADGDEEVLTLQEVDDELKASGNPAPPIRCLEAVAESPGYGVKRGPDQGLVLEFVPPFVNPNLSDPAAQASISNSVFRDTVRSCSTLSVVDAEDMTASEWLRLLVLLVTKCSTNDSLQGVAGEMESKANDFMSELITETSKITSFYDLLPKVTDDEYEGDDDGDDEEDRSSGREAAEPADAAPTANGDIKMVDLSAESATAKQDGEAPMEVDVEVVEAELVEAIPVVEAVPSNDTNEAATDITKSSLSGMASGRNTPSASGRNTPASTIGLDEVISEDELRRRQIAKAKAKRRKEVEDCYVASAI